MVNDEYYHIIGRSIARYEVFNDQDDYQRFVDILDLYRFGDFYYRYSQFQLLDWNMQIAIRNNIRESNDQLVEIIAYCIMPTHYHLILGQISDKGISKYMGKVLGSYSLYFNIKHKRHGPLWEGKFKNVSVSTDEQLLHLTRYIHLNPVSANLAKNPEDWAYSSYHDYVGNNPSASMCKYSQILDIEPKTYKKFVKDRISYQKELSKIKNILLENYTG